MTTIHLVIAFYSGKGDYRDTLIRWWTGPYALQLAKFSHCELVFPDGLSISASPRDGGVRVKEIDFDPDHWEFVALECTREEIKNLRSWCETRVGQPYDWLGIWFNEFLRLGIRKEGAIYCSYFCGEALKSINKLPEYSKKHLSPQALYNLIISMPKAFFAEEL